MINKLTKEQEKLIPVIVDKWIKRGLSTDKFTHAEASNIFNNLNKYILQGKDKPLFIFNSPIECWFFICLMEQNKLNQVENQVENQVGNQVGNQVENQVENQVWNQVENQVRNQVWNQVGNQVENQVENQVWNQVWNQVENQVWNQVWNQVRNQVWNQVWNQVGNQVRNQVGNQVWKLKLVNFVYPYLFGSFDVGYFSWTDFMLNIGVKNLPNTVNFYLESYKLGLVFVLDNYAVISQKPDLIKKNNNGLHCENGPALTYDDNGISDIYALNGVVMDKKYVETPAEKLDAKIILSETNVEIRRELLRKIGIERFLRVATHKVLDKKDNYELLSIELNEQIKDAKYLKMINPSVGCFHVEGVDPKCLTVEHAINWRTYQDINKKWSPEILT